MTYDDLKLGKWVHVEVEGFDEPMKLRVYLVKEGDLADVILAHGRRDGFQYTFSPPYKYPQWGEIPSEPWERVGEPEPVKTSVRFTQSELDEIDQAVLQVVRHHNEYAMRVYDAGDSPYIPTWGYVTAGLIVNDLFVNQGGIRFPKPLSEAAAGLKFDSLYSRNPKQYAAVQGSLKRLARAGELNSILGDSVMSPGGRWSEVVTYFDPLILGHGGMESDD